MWSRRSTCRQVQGRSLFAVSRGRAPLAFSRGIRKFRDAERRKTGRRDRERRQNSPGSAGDARNALVIIAKLIHPSAVPRTPSAPANRSLSILPPFFRRTTRIEAPEEKTGQLSGERFIAVRGSRCSPFFPSFRSDVQLLCRVMDLITECSTELLPGCSCDRDARISVTFGRGIVNSGRADRRVAYPR